MTDAVIDEIDGRMIRIGDHWLADFASCNYLGFDLDREVMDAIPEYVAKWGTHPSWSRLLGSPVLYEQIEERLTGLLGAPDVLVFPTITLIHLSVIPLLAASGTVFVDRRAHKTIYEGAELATLRGATLQRFEHNDLDQLESLLRSDPSTARLICIDGVNSMTGNVADLASYASLATTLRGLEVNDRRGDVLRADLWAKTQRVLECLDRLGVRTPNRQGLPIVEVPLANAEQIGDVGKFLFENGIYVTLAAYPLVPRSEVGFRIQLTAANTDTEVERLVAVLGKLAASFDLQTVTEQAA